MAMNDRGGGGARAREIWSNVSRKAKSALSDDRRWFRGRDGFPLRDEENISCENVRGSESAAKKKLEAFASSLTQFGGSIGNAIEEKFTLFESKASNLMSMRSPSRKIRKESAVLPLEEMTNVAIDFSTQMEQRMKSLREELDFAYRRCEKLEGEKEDLKRENEEVKRGKEDLKREKEEVKREKEEVKQENEKLIDKLKQQAEVAMMVGEDDLVRLQLEKLHREKSSLAKDRENLAREVRFLRGLMEFHQLSLQELYQEEDLE